FVIRLRQKNNYPLEMIANMNVTLVWFDMAGGLTVNPKDAKTVPIRTTENDKNRFTIVLMCFANSRKLLPIIIFKEKGWPANAPRPLTDIVVWFQEKGWMDELGMSKWAEFRSGNTDLAVIPGGLMRNLKCASLNMVYHWVLNTWNKISENNIVRAFKKYGISNCLSGSEGHLIYATNDESDEDKIEDFNDSKKEKFDEDNEDKEFDENEEFNEIKESDKDAECDGDESDSDEMMVMNLIIGLASENTFSKQEERDNRRISEKDSPREEAETMSMMIEENSGELKEKEQANSMQLDKNREIREKVTESLETYTLWDIPRNFNNCRIKTLMRRY
ncbi:2939_t:CDS:2, partial [Gigaspora rosea]